jgi:hypothetical protein
MRPLLVMTSLALLGALSSGCAHALESREDRVVVAVDTKSSEPATEVTEAPPVIVTEPAVARPRLSRTVTLGEGTAEPVYATPPRTQGTGQPGPNVVVNNNITVVGSPPVYGGYGGASYGRSFNSGVGYGMRDASGRGSGSHSAWAPSGWEGAGRTAAPGQTPHVGGNWSPAPSHGPRQFK